MGRVVQRASPSKPAQNLMAGLGWLGQFFLTCPGLRLSSGFTINAWLGLCGPGLFFFYNFFFKIKLNLFLFYFIFYVGQPLQGRDPPQQSKP
jgi:hypothetical protein